MPKGGPPPPLPAPRSRGQAPLARQRSTSAFPGSDAGRCRLAIVAERYTASADSFSGGLLVPSFPRRLTAVLTPALLLAGAAATAPTAAAATGGAVWPAPIVAGDTVRFGSPLDGAA